MYKSKPKDDKPKDDSNNKQEQDKKLKDEWPHRLFAPVNGFQDGPKLGPDGETEYYHIPVINRNYWPDK